MRMVLMSCGLVGAALAGGPISAGDGAEGSRSFDLADLDFAAARAFQAPAAPPRGGGGAFASPLGPGAVSVKGGMGFSADPGTFLLAGQADFFLNPSLSLGPLLQFGVSDDEVILAPTVNAQWVFHLPAPEVERLKPFVQGGLGFAYLHDDHHEGSNDDIGFLLNLGFGAEYYVAEKLALGTNFLFNVLPDKTLGENFFFSWQVVTARFVF